MTPLLALGVASETALAVTLPASPAGGAAYGYADSAEHREGIAAFLGKRPPNF